MLNPRKSDWLIFVVAVIAFIALIAFRTQQFPGDSLSFAFDIKQGNDLFHPHHLLFSFSVFLFQKFLSLFSNGIDVLLSAQIFNALWAAIGLIICFRIVMTLFADRMLAYAITLALLFAHEYWSFATSVEVYVPAMVCSMIVFYLLIQDNFSARRNLLIALFLAAAVFFHQASVFLVVPVIIFVFMKTKNIRVAFTGSVMAGFLVFTGYIISFLSGGMSFTVDGFMRYVFAYAYDAQVDWGTGADFSGNGILTLSANQAFCFLYHKINITGGLNISFLLLLTVSFLLNAIQIFRGDAKRLERMFVLLWLILNYIFLLWWTPGYELLIPTIFPVLMLLTWCLNDALIFIQQRKTFHKFQIMIVVFAGIYFLEYHYNTAVFAENHSQESEGKTEAEFIYQNMNQKSRLIEEYGVYVNLKYFHDYDHSIEVNRLIPSFYHHDSLRIDFKIANDENIIAPSWMVNPWFESFGSNGWKNPQEWFQYFNYLFDIRKVTDDSISFRDFEIVPSHGNNKPNMLKIFSERKEIASIESLFQLLDSQFRNANAPQEMVYKEWFDKNQNAIAVNQRP